MVGVPGRSKGCGTCKKRRLKCDETKPRCQRCEKSGYVCKGYERTLDVRMHSFEPETGVTKAKRLRTTTPAVDVDANDAPFPPFVNLTAFKDNMQYSLLFDSLIWIQYGSCWLQRAALGKFGVLALEAAQALSLNIFGQHNNLPNAEIEAAQYYSSALRKLSAELETIYEDHTGKEYLLMPILILIVHSLAGSNPQETAIHLQALHELLQVLGPGPFAASKTLRGPLESCKVMLITSAFMTRTRLIFEDEVWNTAYKPLWGDVRAPSIFGNQLLASLAHVPGLLQDQEELVLTQDDHLRQEIISKIKVQLSLLYTWRWHFEHPDSSCGPDVDWQPEHHVLGLTHSYTSVCPSWRQALEVTCYNMAVLSLLGMLWSLEGRPEGGPLRFYSDNVPLSVPPLPNQISSLEQVATVVCRGFEDSLRSGLMQRA